VILMSATTETRERWTIHDLEGFPQDDGKRYEIIEGELYVASQPHLQHQRTCHRIAIELENWVNSGGSGEVIPAPGVIFDPENAVAPDLVWISAQTQARLTVEHGKLYDAPDLAVEVLSPGSTNARRDQHTKLRLYSKRGVREYWIVDWEARSLQVFRREAGALELMLTLLADDELTSPLLPGFAVTVARLLPK
jgi:Uma2 family endonuclease